MSGNESNIIIEECRSAVKDTITKLKKYILDNSTFAGIGQRIIDVWEFSLTQTETIREIPDDIIRNW